MAPPPNITQLTMAQVHTLITIIERVGQIGREYQFGEEVHAAPEDMRLAIETTVIKASNVLDDILDNKDRWSTKSSQDTSAAIQDALSAQIVKTQTETNESIRKQYPSTLLKPALYQRNGVWYVKYGKQKGALVGKGDTPYEAMRDFDVKFLGGTSNPEESDTNE